jgi:hypothetical protein
MTQFGKLFELLLPNIENLKYQSTNLGGEFRFKLFFSIIVGLTPILLFLTWQLAPIRLLKYRFFSGLIVIFFIIISIVLRQHLIKATFNLVTNFKTQTTETIYTAFSIDNLHFEYYLLCGIILGCVLSYFLFQEKTKFKNNK